MAKLRVKWFGHAAFYIELEGKRLLIDPWVTHPLSPTTVDEVVNLKPTHILVTHDHFDHLGESLDIAKKTGTPIIGVYELTL